VKKQANKKSFPWCLQEGSRE